ncbi:SapC family protein [Caulobacter sp. 17J80-11]|uniref:SapC family protein n=1 Tax=Caulobacter sp. 17J80-11 TaxID=2763502 RepID=UPI00165346F1|nr:SapC family protein [Caulobacter sp. 17J80-11]MBC6980209.1 SapC family protein [Caulobacter sp. 17J80-11]
MEQTQAAGALTGNVLFYGQPEPLNPELHGALGVNRTAKPYGFVTQTHVVPLTVTEFAPASLSYPIVFVGDAKSPIAVMGLRQGENLFVTADGEFRMDAYIPAFVRRYPFVFANDDQQQRMILCVDRNAPFVSDKPDVPFFENGEPSAYTKNAMQFCTDFETERQRTESFVKLLSDLDLFDVREAVFTPQNPDGTPGQPQKIAEYFAVSEDKLKALPIEKLAELRDNGALGQIYAHLVSLLGWDKLIALAVSRAAPTAANA